MGVLSVRVTVGATTTSYGRSHTNYKYFKNTVESWKKDKTIASVEVKEDKVTVIAKWKNGMERHASYFPHLGEEID